MQDFIGIEFACYCNYTGIPQLVTEQLIEDRF